MIVKIDVDGVLRNFVESLIREYKIEFPDKWYKQVETWDLHPYFEINTDIYDFAFNKKAFNIFYLGVGYIDNIIFLRDFIKNKNRLEIKIVTNNYDRCFYYTECWLWNWGIKNIEVISTKHKPEVLGDVLIDDDPVNLRASENAGELPIAISQPWNYNKWNGHREIFLKNAIEIAIKKEGSIK
jgi:hypothetical protein